MKVIAAFKSLIKMRLLSLLVIILVSSTLLILVNYFTIRITSAVRAYINGESQYSKGQKEASVNLIMYLYSEDPSYWEDFRNGIAIPLGDSIARVELMRDGDVTLIRKGFLQGNNNEADIDLMIWLFRNFKNYSFMKESISIWKTGDRLIGQTCLLGDEVHAGIRAGIFGPAEKSALTKRIKVNTIELTRLERAFSDNLGATARNVNAYLFYFNLFLIVLIIGSSSGYTMMMLNRLKEKNDDLQVINNELDKFVYSASHDLRAPISSMKGLVGLAMQEKDQEMSQFYLDLMMSTLNKQDLFISEIIDHSRNKKTKIEKKEISLTRIIDQAIVQHQFMPGAPTIDIRREIRLDVILADPFRLEIIINNLLSNAFKYNDVAKDNKFISISTSQQEKHAVIQIADNGIGIDKDHVDQIFDMFFVTQHNQRGSGLGLYITKEAVMKLHGTIDVESEKGIGTTFTIRMPMSAQA